MSPMVNGRRKTLCRGGLVCVALVACIALVLSKSPQSQLASASPQRVLVTGGNKGIGKALCRQLVVDHGYHVLLGSRDESRGVAAVDDIVKAHPECKDMIECLPLDVADPDSVSSAAATVAAKYGTEPAPLYGIVNNAGVYDGGTMERTLEVNTYGTVRVCDAFMPLLNQETGRIVLTASASGPNFVNGCYGSDRATAELLIKPEVTWEELDDLMQRVIANPGSKQPYGFSKACVNAYTMYLARKHPHLKINAITPGFILTDMTAFMGATKSPEEGTKAAIHCLMGDLEGNGRYYGSDAVRSPLNRYRAPGDPPYTGP